MQITHVPKVGSGDVGDAKHRAANEENMSFGSSMVSSRLHSYLEVCLK